MMANHIENFQQLDPNMMLPSISTPLALPTMDHSDTMMTHDMMKSMVKENFNEPDGGPEGSIDHDDHCEGEGCEPFGDGNDGEYVDHDEHCEGEGCEPFEDGDEGEHVDHDEHCEGEGCEPFEDGDEGEHVDHDEHCEGEGCENFEEVTDDGVSHDNECPDGEVCEHFEDEIEDDVEGFEGTENKDMELWTCYPSNNENFENVNDSLFYSAEGGLANGASNKSQIHPQDLEMKNLYMYLAIAVVMLLVIYLLTNHK